MKKPAQKSELVAYHGDKAVKQKYLDRVAMHRKLDHLTQGVAWESNGTTKGCAVGCTLEKYDHKAYEVELGIPFQIAELEDAIFEGLPREEAMAWPERFLSAIKPGADLRLVYPKFIVWLLEDPKDGVIRFAEADGIKAIQMVTTLWKDRIKGKEHPAAAWDTARAAARAAAWAAARDTSWDAARAAAWDAARDAARAAARDAARAAARAAAYRKQADKLIELLQDAR